MVILFEFISHVATDHVFCSLIKMGGFVDTTCMWKANIRSIPQTHSLFTYQDKKNYFLYKLNWLYMVGDADIGKTSVLDSFAGDDFNPTYI